jgi:hypothetical protein
VALLNDSQLILLIDRADVVAQKALWQRWGGLDVPSLHANGKPNLTPVFQFRKKAQRSFDRLCLQLPRAAL